MSQTAPAAPVVMTTGARLVVAGPHADRLMALPATGTPGGAAVSMGAHGRRPTASGIAANAADHLATTGVMAVMGAVWSARVIALCADPGRPRATMIGTDRRVAVVAHPPLLVLVPGHVRRVAAPSGTIKSRCAAVLTAATHGAARWPVELIRATHVRYGAAS